MTNVHLHPEFKDFLANLDPIKSVLLATKDDDFWAKLANDLLSDFDTRIIVGDDPVLDGENPLNNGFWVVGYRGTQDDQIKWLEVVSHPKAYHIMDGGRLPQIVYSYILTGKTGPFYLGLDVDDALLDNKALFNVGMRGLVDEHTSQLIQGITGQNIGPQFDRTYTIHKQYPVTPVLPDYRGNPIEYDLEVTMITVSVAEALGIPMEKVLEEVKRNGSIYATLVDWSERFTGLLGTYISEVVRKIEKAKGAGRTEILPEFREDQRAISRPENVGPYLNMDLINGINELKSGLSDLMTYVLLTSSHRYKSWLSYARTGV